MDSNTCDFVWHYIDDTKHGTYQHCEIPLAFHGISRTHEQQTVATVSLIVHPAQKRVSIVNLPALELYLH